MNKSAPQINTRIEEKLPRHLIPVSKVGRVRCPRCNSNQTGFYEVSVFRRQGRINENGNIEGERIDSVLDYEDVIRDGSDRLLLDCVACGYEFTIEVAPSPLFLGEGI